MEFSNDTRTDSYQIDGGGYRTAVFEYTPQMKAQITDVHLQWSYDGQSSPLVTIYHSSDSPLGPDVPVNGPAHCMPDSVDAWEVEVDPTTGAIFKGCCARTGTWYITFYNDDRDLTRSSEEREATITVEDVVQDTGSQQNLIGVLEGATIEYPTAAYTPVESTFALSQSQVDTLLFNNEGDIDPLYVVNAAGAWNIDPTHSLDVMITYNITTSGIASPGDLTFRLHRGSDLCHSVVYELGSPEVSFLDDDLGYLSLRLPPTNNAEFTNNLDYQFDDTEIITPDACYNYMEFREPLYSGLQLSVQTAGTVSDLVDADFTVTFELFPQVLFNQDDEVVYTVAAEDENRIYDDNYEIFYFDWSEVYQESYDYRQFPSFADSAKLRVYIEVIEPICPNITTCDEFTNDCNITLGVCEWEPDVWMLTPLISYEAPQWPSISGAPQSMDVCNVDDTFNGDWTLDESSSREFFNFTSPLCSADGRCMHPGNYYVTLGHQHNETVEFNIYWDIIDVLERDVDIPRLNIGNSGDASVTLDTDGSFYVEYSQDEEHLYLDAQNRYPSWVAPGLRISSNEPFTLWQEWQCQSDIVNCAGSGPCNFYVDPCMFTADKRASNENTNPFQSRPETILYGTTSSSGSVEAHWIWPAVFSGIDFDLTRLPNNEFNNDYEIGTDAMHMFEFETGPVSEYNQRTLEIIITSEACATADLVAYKTYNDGYDFATPVCSETSATIAPDTENSGLSISDQDFQGGKVFITVHNQGASTAYNLQVRWVDAPVSIMGKECVHVTSHIGEKVVVEFNGEAFGTEVTFNVDVSETELRIDSGLFATMLRDNIAQKVFSVNRFNGHDDDNLVDGSYQCTPHTELDFHATLGSGCPRYTCSFSVDPCAFQNGKYVLDVYYPNSFIWVQYDRKTIATYLLTQGELYASITGQVRADHYGERSRHHSRQYYRFAYDEWSPSTIFQLLARTHYAQDVLTVEVWDIPSLTDEGPSLSQSSSNNVCDSSSSSSYVTRRYTVMSAQDVDWNDDNLFLPRYGAQTHPGRSEEISCQTEGWHTVDYISSCSLADTCSGEFMIAVRGLYSEGWLTRELVPYDLHVAAINPTPIDLSPELLNENGCTTFCSSIGIGGLDYFTMNATRGQFVSFFVDSDQLVSLTDSTIGIGTLNENLRIEMSQGPSTPLDIFFNEFALDSSSCPSPDCSEPFGNECFDTVECFDQTTMAVTRLESLNTSPQFHACSHMK